MTDHQHVFASQFPLSVHRLISASVSLVFCNNLGKCVGLGGPSGQPIPSYISAARPRFWCCFCAVFFFTNKSSNGSKRHPKLPKTTPKMTPETNFWQTLYKSENIDFGYYLQYMRHVAHPGNPPISCSEPSENRSRTWNPYKCVFLAVSNGFLVKNVSLRLTVIPPETTWFRPFSPTCGPCSACATKSDARDPQTIQIAPKLTPEAPKVSPN